MRKTTKVMVALGAASLTALAAATIGSAVSSASTPHPKPVNPKHYRTPPKATQTPKPETKPAPPTFTAVTVHVSWDTNIAPGGANPPKDSGDVTWSQPIDTGACGTGWIQNDAYVAHSQAELDAINALIKHGVLNKPGSATWTDTAWVQTWNFTPRTPCHTTPTVKPVTFTDQVGCTAASYTNPAQDGVSFTDADGNPVAPGTHNLPANFAGTITINAIDTVTGQPIPPAFTHTFAPADLCVNPGTVHATITGACGQPVHIVATVDKDGVPTRLTAIDIPADGVPFSPPLADFTVQPGTTVTKDVPLTSATRTTAGPDTVNLLIAGLTSTDNIGAATAEIQAECPAVTTVPPPPSNTPKPPKPPVPAVVVATSSPASPAAQPTQPVDTAVLASTGANTSPALKWGLLGLGLGIVLLLAVSLGMFGGKRREEATPIDDLLS